MEEQDLPEVSPGQIGLKWGMIYGIVSTIVNLIPVITETAISIGFALIFVNIVIAFVFYILADREFKRLNGGQLTFGQGFKINMIAAVIAGVVRPLINYVYIKFIDTDYLDRLTRAMEEQWERQGLNEQQIEQARSFASGTTNPEAQLIFGILFVILGGLLWGSIAAAIQKKEEDEF